MNKDEKEHDMTHTSTEQLLLDIEGIKMLDGKKAGFLFSTFHPANLTSILMNEYKAKRNGEFFPRSFVSNSWQWGEPFDETISMFLMDISIHGYYIDDIVLSKVGHDNAEYITFIVVEDETGETNITADVIQAIIDMSEIKLQW